MSKHEDVLEALRKSIELSVPAALVLRNQEKPDTAPDGGLVIIWDGDPGQPEEYFCPRTFEYSRRVSVEAAVYSDAVSKESALSDILTAIQNGLAIDRTLGGICNWVEPEVSGAVTANFEAKGTQTGLSAEFAIMANYDTCDPLN